MLSLQSAYDLFIQSRDTYCSDVTVSNYTNTLNYFINFMKDYTGKESSDIDVDCIGIYELNEYSIFLKNKVKNDNNPYKKTDSSVKISDRTRKDYLKDMCTFMNFLFENEYIEKNPADKLKLPRVQVQPIEPLTNDEVDILDGCYNVNSKLGCRNLAIIHLLLDEGLRSGEVQRLKIADIHFDEDYIVIRKSKYNKGRIVPLAAIPKMYLEKYLEFEKREAPDYVFVTNNGEQLTADSIKCFFQRLKKRSKISRIYPHLLRHTFATSFILGGGSLELLRIYMGHSSIETTQKYLHLANNMRFMKNVYRLDDCFLKKFY